MKYARWSDAALRRLGSADRMDNAGLVFGTAPGWRQIANARIRLLSDSRNGEAIGGHEAAEGFTDLSDGCVIEADRKVRCRPRHVSVLPDFPRYKIGEKLAGTLEHNW